MFHNRTQNAGNIGLFLHICQAGMPIISDLAKPPFHRLHGAPMHNKVLL
jgi:hypothetical protein